MINFVFYSNPTVTLICVPADAPVRHSLATTADLAGVHPDRLRHYCRLGLLGPERANPDREPTFDDDALYTLRRLEHYRREHGASLPALAVIRVLERQVDQLREEVRYLRQR